MYSKIVTHDGKFHADEVFAIGLVLELHRDVPVERTRDRALISRYINHGDVAVIDIGGVYDPEMGNFDHHQRGGPGVSHEDNTPIASFGLVYRKVKTALKWKHGFSLQEALEEALLKELIVPIDAIDNGIDGYPDHWSRLIEDLNPSWMEKGEGVEEEQFKMAVQFARTVIRRLIARVTAEVVAGEVTDSGSLIADGKALVLPCDLPWEKTIYSDPRRSDLRYVIYPDHHRVWRIRTVPTEAEGFTPRAPLPEEWRGLRDQDLVDACGVEGAVFCHPAGFMAGAVSKEAAEAMVSAASKS